MTPPPHPPTASSQPPWKTGQILERKLEMLELRVVALEKQEMPTSLVLESDKLERALHCFTHSLEFMANEIFINFLILFFVWCFVHLINKYLFCWTRWTKNRLIKSKNNLFFISKVYFNLIYRKIQNKKATSKTTVQKLINLFFSTLDNERWCQFWGGSGRRRLCLGDASSDGLLLPADVWSSANRRLRPWSSA